MGIPKTQRLCCPKTGMRRSSTENGPRRLCVGAALPCRGTVTYSKLPESKSFFISSHIDRPVAFQNSRTEGKRGTVCEPADVADGITILNPIFCDITPLSHEPLCKDGHGDTPLRTLQILAHSSSNHIQITYSLFSNICEHSLTVF